jgi:hypothetical protein
VGLGVFYTVPVCLAGLIVILWLERDEDVEYGMVL